MIPWTFNVSTKKKLRFIASKWWLLRLKLIPRPWTMHQARLLTVFLEYSNAWSVSREFYILKYIRVQRQGRFKTQNQNKTARYQNHKLLVFFLLLFLRGTFLSYGTLNFQTSNRLFPVNNLTWMEWKQIEYVIFFWSFPLRFYRNYFPSAMYFEIVLNAASEITLIIKSQQNSFSLSEYFSIRRTTIRYSTDH